MLAKAVVLLSSHLTLDLNPQIRYPEYTFFQGVCMFRELDGGWYEADCLFCGETMLIEAEDDITVHTNPDGTILGICCHVCVKNDVGCYTKVPPLPE
jgi:hypothetical protein